jgi:hypothetical protein
MGMESTITTNRCGKSNPGPRRFPRKLTVFYGIELSGIAQDRWLHVWRIFQSQGPVPALVMDVRLPTATHVHF